MTKKRSATKRARPTYTAQQRAHAVTLATAYGNAARAARETGIPAQTIGRWLNEPSEETLKIVSQVHKSLADRLTDSMMEAHDALMANLRAGKLSPGQTIAAFGVLFDKRMAHLEAERRAGPSDDGLSELDKIAEALMN